MDSGQLNSLLKRLCKTLWEAQVSNPITYVTQLSYLLLLKMLEEMDAEHEDAGNEKRKTLFTEVSTASWGKKRPQKASVKHARLKKRDRRR